ncbi:hypothetical protein SAMN05880545_0990 [Microbacterium sp. RU33B]|nr:hypothetical protein SAMN05880545_0990 [Microbacterium sp. RU33B]
MHQNDNMLARVVALGFGVAVVMMTIAGCSPSAANYADLDREPASGDALPDVFEETASEIQDGSSRLIGEHGGDTIWIARGTAPDHVCLAVLDASDEAAVACGSDSGPLQFGWYVVFSDGAPTPTGTMLLSENVATADR